MMGSEVLAGQCLHSCPPHLHRRRSPALSQALRASSKPDNVPSTGGAAEEPRGVAKLFHKSDGEQHLGFTLAKAKREFPGPPSGDGPPLRILPIGGLGEIGMNCMLVGVHDRYILIDAGLMFPDFTDYGMSKLLPDTNFLAQWKDKIEALIITHGHEDHIGALPWVLPALDPKTPVWAAGYTMQLLSRRMQEFGMWDPDRFHVFNMRQRFDLGPFECEPVRVTHSIPDCCGMILRSEHGTIVHTGDWNNDVSPVDGDKLDQTAFEEVGREGVALMMSDSTNVMVPGHCSSETNTRENLVRRVQEHQGQGRVIVTQFASNLHRMAGVKAAADAAGREIAFMGTSLHSYLEAAERVGRAPVDPRKILTPAQADEIDPNKLLIITTGSQAEERAQLCLASQKQSHMLRLRKSDLVLYAARVIPGNDKQVVKMLNSIAELGPRIVSGRDAGLHASGHSYRDDLKDMLRLVKPQHFLPVHGEYSFLCAHAELAQQQGLRHTSVIRNGQLLGVSPGRNGSSMSGMTILGRALLDQLYNDGNDGTGNAHEVALEDRRVLALEGLVVVALVVKRPTDGQPLAAQSIRVTTRAMWTKRGELVKQMQKALARAINRLPANASIVAAEELVRSSILRECRAFNRRKPEVIIVVTDADPNSKLAKEAAESSASLADVSPSERPQRRQRKALGTGKADPQQQAARRRRNPREDAKQGSPPDKVEYA